MISQCTLFRGFLLLHKPAYDLALLILLFFAVALIRPIVIILNIIYECNTNYCEQNLKLQNVQYQHLFSPSDQITENTKTVTYKKVLNDCRGTRELYTPSPLLYCREELHEILAKRLHGWWGRKTRRNQQTWKILQFAFS